MQDIEAWQTRWLLLFYSFFYFMVKADSYSMFTKAGCMQMLCSLLFL